MLYQVIQYNINILKAYYRNNLISAEIILKASWFHIGLFINAYVFTSTFCGIFIIFTHRTKNYSSRFVAWLLILIDCNRIMFFTNIHYHQCHFVTFTFRVLLNKGISEINKRGFECHLSFTNAPWATK